jgi:hypothetical protein
MPTILSPNMNLPVPVVSQEPGPEYAIDINACMSLLDSHSHQPGSGVPISTGAINIDAALTFNSFSLEDLRDAKFTPQVSTLVTPSDKNSVYVVVDDLYYNNSAGTPIRITQAGAVVGTPGSITNLLPPASASYVPLSAKFVWQSAVNTSADMDFGSAIMRNATLSSFGLTLAPPTLTADYQITLPLLPSSQKIMTLDSSGAMTAPYVLDNSTLEVALNIIQIKDNGVTNAKLAGMPALSVKANATNASANPTDVVAANDGEVLLRSGTALAFGQIVAAGISTDAVTTPKIQNGAVTSVKLAGINLVTSAAVSGTLSGAGSTQIASVSFTTQNSNRAVLIGLQCGSTASPAYLNFDDNTGAATMYIDFRVDGSSVAAVAAQMIHTGAGYILRLPPTAFSHLIQLSAGAATVSVNAVCSGASCIIDWSNIQLIVREV